MSQSRRIYKRIETEKDLKIGTVLSITVESTKELKLNSHDLVKHLNPNVESTKELKLATAPPSEEKKQ